MGRGSVGREQAIGRHENRVLGDASPREIMRKMGVIERMVPPFQYAMPYYVSNKYAHLTIHAESRDRRDGGVTCELLLPDGSSVEAVGRVAWSKRLMRAEERRRFAGVGVEFLGGAPEQFDALDRYISKRIDA